MTDVADVLVVGSGCAGAMAAQTLVEANVRTALVCAGTEPPAVPEPNPALDFAELRRTDDDQHASLLGAKLEGLVLDASKGGPQLTPARKHLVRDVARWLPLLSDTFSPVESLAIGGLGGGWGLGACVFSNAELDAAGLDASAMKTSYARIIERIGVSGADDDAARYTHGGSSQVMEAPSLDAIGRGVLERYARRRARLQRDDLHLGRTALALITRPLGDRAAYQPRDLDFYSDLGGSAFRPARTIEALKRQPHFQHHEGWVVTRFDEGPEFVDVHALHRESSTPRVFRARSVMLAAGPLGTARVVLRSTNRTAELPILCSPYAYVPCVQPRLLGDHGRQHHFGFSQLSLFHDPGGEHRDVAMGSIYSYRSLMLFRLAQQAPVGLADAWRLLRYLMPALTIVGVHQPEPARFGGRLSLQPANSSPTGDALHVDYPVSDERQRAIARRIGLFRRAMRALGAWPLQTVRPAFGASIHYAGTLPFDDGGSPHSVQRDGRLGGSQRVYVADASGFRFLPAKGPTLSLMANADAVARGWVARHG